MKKLLMALAMPLAMYGILSAAVNINTATKEELTSLRGIGEKRAQDIINYRTKNGPFKTVDDLEKVPGIGPGLMKRIRPQITTTGKTTTDKSQDDTKTNAGDSAKTTKPDTKKAEPAKDDATKANRKAEKK
ncbi:MAG TPA: helix-hairpin-helix domain-containing protein [Candidatus Udaeobacter sp.]|nr:helix-hairpin-helix domain-containing protein [Candidatus Udaeobacter sp.]